MAPSPLPSRRSAATRRRGPARLARRVGLRLARHRSAAAALGAAAALAVASLQVDADRRAWGTMAEAVVVRQPVAAGSVVDAADVAVEPRPQGVVPHGAATEVDAVVGSATRTALVPGEVVVAERLAGRGMAGTAAVVPAGRRALAVPHDLAALPLQIGDRVDLVGGGAPWGGGLLAQRAVVVGVGDAGVVVAVTDEEVVAVAGGLGVGEVVVALRGV